MSFPSLKDQQPPLLCIVLPESALLAETRTDWHSATDGRTHLCPESSGNSGRTRAGTGMTLEKQRSPPPLCQTDPKSGIPSDGSTSILPAWVSVLTENRPRGSVFPERELPSRTGTCPGTKGEDGAQACPGCATVIPPDGLCGTQPPCCPFWLWYDSPRKIHQSQEDSPEFQAVMCQERNPPVHSPLAGLPSKTAPQPVIDASVVIIWRRWIALILTPLWRKAESRHCKRGREQLRDTLIRRVAGTVGCNLSSFIHQRNGLMWSNPRGNTGEAAAMRPNSLRQVPTETWWPSLKRARHAVKLDIRAGAKRACIWMESKRSPRNTVRWDGRSTLFLPFILRPRWCGGERYPCDDLLAPWSEPEWASCPDSSAHECPGASKGPVQHPCILWTFSAPRPGRKASGRRLSLEQGISGWRTLVRCPTEVFPLSLLSVGGRKVPVVE